MYPRLTCQQYKRVGICNGKLCRKMRHKPDVPIFRVADYRYRCKECFKIERGSNP